MKEPIVNVGIMFEEVINFEFHGEYCCESTGATLTGLHTASFKEGKILYDNQLFDVLVFEPTNYNTDCVELKDVVIGINFHWERKENQQFKGGLKLIVENGKLTAINQIGVESYLTSVISSEMSATSSPELLRAHAVISRSWLLAQIEKNKSLEETSLYQSTFRTDDELIKWYDREDHTLFDVCADDHCQRYQGIIRQNDAVALAIEATRGLILEYDGKICDARFSKSCGGVTEKFENCWEPVAHDYLTVLRDTPEENDFEDLTDEATAEKWIRTDPPAFCNTHDKEVLSQVLNDYDQETTDFYRWKVTYAQQELSALITKRSGIDFGEIIDLIPVERGTSGRLIKLKIVGTKRTMTIGKELEIRKYLSTSHLYSSAFVVDKSGNGSVPESFTLTGAGWGHGVGLCQIGAAVMSSKGYPYDKILLHYFKGADLVKRY
ncbi:SpoIID/LytB domain-containing protein [Paludibacter jiangxiensis]|uniref:SpoIID/LytB domain protein n=1 Tax=Paludibacter jiangxiensis TaxID=681398 RepID=A0A161LD15_9BACT|nr:SpoIID/LytB domain-containing protein [Paludibacter jiangxiensis]GAT61915.1 SpoIID/LytB domain protein [Paludibacter jiangxiensis]